jgi:hypothetical protein
MKEKRISYLDYQSLFSTVNYKIFNTKGVEVSVNNFEKLIPSQGTVDLIAVPN